MNPPNDFQYYYVNHTKLESAKYFGVSKSTVSKWAKKLGLSKLKKKPNREDFVRFYSSHTQKETAEHFGLSVSGVRNLAKLYKFKKDKDELRIAHCKMPDDIDEFVKYYDCHSREQTAKKYNVDDRTVTNWKQHLGLPNKTRKQIGTYQRYKVIKGSDNKRWNGYERISGAFWGRIKNNAKSRDINFNISIEDAWNQFVKQDGKCALSGYPLCLDFTNTDYSRKTASLDRIDNNKGYEKDNIQWLHKDVNWIKGRFTTERLLELCRAICQNTEE